MTRGDWMSVRGFLDWTRELDQAFDDLIHEPWGRTARTDWSPAVDIDETPDGYIVYVDVPGFCTGDVEVGVRPRKIEIGGTRTVTRTVETATRIHRERVTGAFRRTFSLERDVDPDSVTCRCERGVYEIHVRKQHPEQDHTEEQRTPHD